MKKIRIAVRLGCFVLGLGVAEAVACSCLPPPTVLDEFGRSAAVVTARVVRIEQDPGERQGLLPSGPRWAVLRVDRAFKGGLKKGEVFRAVNGNGASCDLMYSPSPVAEYLLYLSEVSGDEPAPAAGAKAYRASLCGRSTETRRARTDLNFLERRAALSGKTWLAGMVYAPGNESAGASNVRVSIVGRGKTINLKTDKAGYFETVGLPAGRYRVTVSPPARWKTATVYSAPHLDGRGRFEPVQDNSITLELKRSTHAEVNFHLVDRDTKL